MRNLILIGAAMTLAALAAGCRLSGENKRVFTQPERTQQALPPESTESDVTRAWGEPDLKVDTHDEKTGKAQTIWIYERFVDANGSRLTTSVTMVDGRVARVEHVPVPRTVDNQGLPRTSESKRDMW